MTLKKNINFILSYAGLAIHGVNYIEKLKRESAAKDAFLSQKEIFEKSSNNELCIFDVGANRGTTIKKYKNLFKDAHIHAFEPTPEVFSTLEKETSGLSNVYIQQLAISEEIGTVTFYLNKSLDTNSLLPSVKIGASSDKGCENITQVQIETTTIDEYCRQNNILAIDILKFDIQGAELKALMGAQKMLEKKAIKLIYTECYFKPQYLNQPLFSNIFSYLTKFDFDLVDFYNPYYVNGSLAWCDAIFIRKK